MTSTKTDKELTVLLTKLYTLQEDVGAKPKTSDEEKRNKALNAAQMGKGRAAKKSGSRFLELKSSVVERLQEIHKLLEEDANRTRVTNPKDIIAAQAAIREQIREATDEWKELDAIYKGEARKRRSKFSPEELEVQQTLVQRLQAEIEKVKELQSRGYARGGQEDIATALNTQALAKLDATTFSGVVASGKTGGAWSGSTGIETTGGQRQQLQLIDERDADFDKQLDELGEGIQDLAEIAQMQGEEVRRQNAMLENTGKNLDKAHEHMQSVNAKMKETLQEVRSSDKFCVDLMCIVLMIGIAAVLYRIISGS